MGAAAWTSWTGWTGMDGGFWLNKITLIRFEFVRVVLGWL
jgi:hypothetical protein